MKFFKKIGAAFNSRVGACIIFILSICSIMFLRGAEWAYGWIAELYPLGDKFIPVFFVVLTVFAFASFDYLLFAAFAGEKLDSIEGVKVIKILHIIFSLLSVVTCIYTLVLAFHFDSGISGEYISAGIRAIASELILFVPAAFIGIALMLCSGKKKTLQALISSVLVSALTLAVFFAADSGISFATQSQNLPELKFQSENVLEKAEIVFESLADNEKADAANLLADNDKCWTAQAPENGKNNSYVEMQLEKPSTVNTATIEEVGNQAQYFRLQAFVGNEWVTLYQSEKIQDMRICSFDAVTTDRIRLSIDKFRNTNTPVKIKSLKLYNEQARNVENFEVTGYQRLDGDVPTEILAKGEEYVKNYARYYDVYSTIIVFAAVHWDEEGNMNFGDSGEEKFAQELEALKEIISMRSNPSHAVRIIVTALADGAWGNGHNGVNTYMALHWEKVADQIAAFAQKYALDGVDIDWEYPASAEDWNTYDRFIQKLDAELREGAIISTALSAGQLGLSKETLDCIDQIQFMAYDGNDTDGYQSSLQQAEEGLRDFVANGADIRKINIGIAAYGRPINSTPYWATWRGLEEANYWNSKYYTVKDADQIYEGTFCAPALAGDKTALALLSGAGGVMVFRVGCDKLPNDPNAVVNGIGNALQRYVLDW